MQGIAKDKESGEYHSVIGKVNKRIDKDGNWKTYMTLSAINKILKVELFCTDTAMLIREVKTCFTKHNCK